MARGRWRRCSSVPRPGVCWMARSAAWCCCWPSRNCVEMKPAASAAQRDLGERLGVFEDRMAHADGLQTAVRHIRHDAERTDLLDDLMTARIVFRRTIID